MLNGFCGIARALILSVGLSIMTGPALAIDLSPDLFIDGSCEDVVIWAAQPVDVLKDDLAARMGDGLATMMQSSSGAAVLKMSKSMPVADNWFENNCTFSEEQLAGMGNLHAAYVAYLEDLADG